MRLEDITHGLRTFNTTFFQAPGRLNFYDEHPFKVLLDYAHNTSALERICEVVNLLEVNGRKIAVLSAPGDRRDEDIQAMAAATVGTFDHYICRRDDNLRGREPDELPKLLAQALISGGVPEDAIECISDELAAVDAALHGALPGDLVVLFADSLQRTWDQIVDFKPDSAVILAEPPPAPVSTLPELPDSDIGEGQAIIRDERGVRLAREIDD